MLLYEIKFLVPNYSCLQNACLGAAAPRSPFCLSSTELVEPPDTKFLGTPVFIISLSTGNYTSYDYSMPLMI